MISSTLIIMSFLIYALISSFKIYLYFDFKLFLNDLKIFKGWSEGLVILEDNQFIRDNQTGWVNGIRF